MLWFLKTILIIISIYCILPYTCEFATLLSYFMSLRDLKIIFNSHLLQALIREQRIAFLMFFFWCPFLGIKVKGCILL